MPIYYDPNGYPQFDIIDEPYEEFGFIHDNLQNPVFIININEAFEVLKATGMSDRECIEYFQIPDLAPCRLDKMGINYG